MIRSRIWCIGLLGLIAIGGGVTVGWAVLVAIGVGLIALLFVPLMLGFGVRPVRAMWWEVSAPVRVVRGDSAAVEMQVSVQSGSARWVSAVGVDPGSRVFVPATSGPAQLSWPIDSTRRGQFSVGPTELVAADPFGFVCNVLATRELSPVLVVPRVHPIDPSQATAARDSGELEGRMGSEVFHSLREYVIGDPQKMIHWRSSAKAGTLMVRRMVDTTVPWIMVVLDTNVRAYDRTESMFEDYNDLAFESAVDTAASWAWWGCGPQQRVLVTTTGCAGAGQHVEVTTRNRESALDWLALVQSIPAESNGPARVAALLRRQGISRLIFVTGARRQSSQSWVAAWRKHVPVHVVSSEDAP